jgi:hypothetical protein
MTPWRPPRMLRNEQALGFALGAEAAQEPRSLAWTVASMLLRILALGAADVPAGAIGLNLTEGWRDSFDGKSSCWPYPHDELGWNI